MIGAKPQDKAKQLVNEQALYAGVDSLQATDARSASAEGEGAGEGGTGGGAGSHVTAWMRPDLVLAAPGGIGSFTPATALIAAGHTLTWIAGQDLQQAVQGNYALAIKNSLSFYTYGQASIPAKPNQETGIRFHAASGNVRVEAQTDAVKLTADQAISVASTNGMVLITAPNHILLTAAGAALDIQSGSITLKAPGMIEFKASMKNLTGPGMASAPAIQFGAAQLQDQKHYLQFVAKDADGNSLAGKPYVLLMPDGTKRSGTTDGQGMTEKVTTDGPQRVNVYIEDADHEGFHVS